MKGNQRSYCTISTASHLYKSYALADSLLPYQGQLNVLLVDEAPPTKGFPDNVVFHTLTDMRSSLGVGIKNKYASNKDKLRWSLKPIFLTHLLSSLSSVIYVDNDVYFYGNPGFLFDELIDHPILLTPHHYPRDPKENQNWFEANFRVGLYNAGFVGANNKAIPALNWWAEACLYRCEKNYLRGLFDDQKYLDLIPIIEPQTKVIHHKGCNTAGWNSKYTDIRLINQNYFIHDSTPLIFYHFNNFSLLHVDPNHEFVSEYIDNLKKYQLSISYDELCTQTSIIDKVKLQIWKWLNQWNA